VCDVISSNKVLVGFFVKFGVGVGYKNVSKSPFFAENLTVKAIINFRFSPCIFKSQSLLLAD